MSPRDEHENYPGLPRWMLEAAGVPAPARAEPSAEMREAAHGMMQAYNAVREAGFTEAQAMKIVTTMISGGRGGK